MPVCACVPGGGADGKSRANFSALPMLRFSCEAAPLCLPPSCKCGSPEEQRFGGEGGGVEDEEKEKKEGLPRQPNDVRKKLEPHGRYRCDSGDVQRSRV